MLGINLKAFNQMDDASTNFVSNIPVENFKIDTKVCNILIYILKIGGSFVHCFNFNFCADANKIAHKSTCNECC